MTTESTATSLQWRDRWGDPWREYWAGELRNVLKAAATSLERMLGLRRNTLGILPAVYFTRLRMGSVPFLRWDKGGPDVDLAFPWGPSYIPAPFTCFAPPVAARTERWFELITRVASVTDAFIDGRAVGRLSRSRDLPNLRLGAFSWNASKNRTIVADEQLLREAEIACTTVTYLLPRLSDWLPYVPLLYIQAHERYDTREAHAAILAATDAGPTPMNARGSRAAAYQRIRTALRAAASAAHARAREWLNQKTQLLNRTGFEGLKEDLEWRVARGEQFAEVFFDIDYFKQANSDYYYDGADLLAARVTDRAVAYVQREVARAYNEAAAFRRALGDYERVAPDSFRALIAHVSGDEFRFFVRQRALQATDRFTEDDPLAFANGLVHAIGASTPFSPASDEGPHTLINRHTRALDASAAGRRAYISDAAITARVIAAHPTVSAGVALDEASVTGVQSPTPEQLASARDRLNALDLRAETAADAAKEAGRNRVALYERSMDDD